MLGESWTNIGVMADTLNVCFDYLVHLLPCVCFLRKCIRFAIVYRALGYNGTLTKKVNLANNHLTLQGKMDSILCENNLRLK